MVMAELKTKPHAGSVSAFLKRLDDPQRRKDCQTVVSLMKSLTGARPMMWGTSIVGFGRYRYRYASGREGDWFLTGFSPRKQSLTIYVMTGAKRYARNLRKLGPHKSGGSCLYLRSLEGIHLPTLRKLLAESIRDLRQRHA